MASRLCWKATPSPCTTPPCHTDPANGFKVLVALPKGTNTDKPNMPIKGGDDAYLWACNKWLLAHPDSAEAAQILYDGICEALA